MAVAAGDDEGCAGIPSSSDLHTMAVLEGTEHVRRRPRILSQTMSFSKLNLGMGLGVDLGLQIAVPC